jgi:hypothetical protein
MPSAGFKPAIPEIKGPQTYNLDRSAIGISFIYTQCLQYAPVAHNTCRHLAP